MLYNLAHSSVQGCSQPQFNVDRHILYTRIHFMMINYWHAGSYMDLLRFSYVCLLITVV